jgi:hypothetical protein
MEVKFLKQMTEMATIIFIQFHGLLLLKRIQQIGSGLYKGSSCGEQGQFGYYNIMSDMEWANKSR